MPTSLENCLRAALLSTLAASLALQPTGALAIVYNGGAGNDNFVGTADADSIYGDPWTMERLSTKSDGTQVTNGDFSDVVYSWDGKKIAFAYNGNDLIAGDTLGYRDVFVKDLESGAVTRVSVDSNGNEVEGDSGQPVFSPDGNLIAFSSNAFALVPGDTNGVSDIFVKNLTTQAVTRVSVKEDGSEVMQGSGAPSFSFDGNAYRLRQQRVQSHQ